MKNVRARSFREKLYRHVATERSFFAARMEPQDESEKTLGSEKTNNAPPQERIDFFIDGATALFRASNENVRKISRLEEKVSGLKELNQVLRERVLESTGHCANLCKEKEELKKENTALKGQIKSRKRRYKDVDSHDSRVLKRTFTFLAQAKRTRQDILAGRVVMTKTPNVIDLESSQDVITIPVVPLLLE